MINLKRDGETYYVLPKEHAVIGSVTLSCKGYVEDGMEKYSLRMDLTVKRKIVEKNKLP